MGFLMSDGTLRLGADSKVPNPGYLKLLVEFGYPHALACRALESVRNESLEAAIEWLDVNRDSLDGGFVDDAQSRHVPNLGSSAPVPAPAAAPLENAALYNSDLRPDGLSRSKLEAEKKAFADLKRQKQADEERERLKKKEQDAKIVRERYAKEKAEKAAKKSAPSPSSSAAPSPAVSSAPKPVANAEKTEVTIQVRVPNRPPLVVKGLLGGSPLAELYSRVDAECGRHDYVLTQPFPPPVLHFQRDDGRTLAQLGLCPRAALTVTDVASLGKVSQGVGGLPEPAAPVGFAPPPVGFAPPPFGGGGGGYALGGGAPVARPHPGVAPAAPAAIAHKYRGPTRTCSICQSDLVAEENAKTMAGCGHVYHDECLSEWSAENGAESCVDCNNGQ